MFPPVYNGAKIIKIRQDFPELWSQMFCHLFMVHSVLHEDVDAAASATSFVAHTDFFTLDKIYADFAAFVKDSREIVDFD